MVLTATATSASAEVGVRAITVDQPVVRYGDVFDLSTLPAPLRERAAGLELAQLPPGGGTIELPIALLARRARLRMPVLARWLPDTETVLTISHRGRFEPPDEAPRSAARCVRIENPIAVGAIPASRDVVPADCPEDALRDAFSYDNSLRSLRARRSLTPGNIVSAPVALIADVAPGDPLIVSIEIGHVRVRRDVAAIQTGRAGGRVFVSGDRGTPFAITLSGEEE